MSRLLLVEDQVNVRRSMRLLFERDGHVVSEAATVAEALRLVETTPLDVVITDVRIDGSGSDGLTLMRELRSGDAGVEVVLITAFGTISDAVEAIKAGAYDYLTKPADPDRLLITVRRAAERSTLAREVRQLRAQVVEDRIVAASREMQRVLATVSQLANTDSTVLITGESGTGKELIARALYEESPRRQGRFVPINCGAVAEALLESELFGHRKGSFTGAVVDKKGLLEEADGGVLFLDEIGEMPLAMQVRLLRFLQGGEVRRVGDTTTRQVNVRLVAATHRDLEVEVAQGRFRQDFFYRINVVGVRIPPLRERTDDIAALAEFFLRRYSARLRRSIVGFAPGAIDLLKAHPWPGNARELENAIERAVNLASGPLLTPEDLPASVFLQVVTAPSSAPLDSHDERSRLMAALEDARWNQSRAATRLGISRTTLWRKMREYRIES